MATQPGSPGAAPLLLDGGIGHLLKAKGVETLVPGLAYDQLFLAGALANDLAPDAVQEVHAAFIAAGGRGGAACLQPAACRSCRQRGAVGSMPPSMWRCAMVPLLQSNRAPLQAPLNPLSCPLQART